VCLRPGDGSDVERPKKTKRIDNDDEEKSDAEGKGAGQWKLTLETDSGEVCKYNANTWTISVVFLY